MFGHGVLQMQGFLFVFESIRIPSIPKIVAGGEFNICPIHLGNCFCFGIDIKLTEYYTSARFSDMRAHAYWDD